MGNDVSAASAQDLIFPKDVRTISRWWNMFTPRHQPRPEYPVAREESTPGADTLTHMVNMVGYNHQSESWLSKSVNAYIYVTSGIDEFGRHTTAGAGSQETASACFP